MEEFNRPIKPSMSQAFADKLRPDAADVCEPGTVFKYLPGQDAGPLQMKHANRLVILMEVGSQSAYDSGRTTSKLVKARDLITGEDVPGHIVRRTDLKRVTGADIMEAQREVASKFFRTGQIIVANLSAQSKCDDLYRISGITKEGELLLADYITNEPVIAKTSEGEEVRVSIRQAGQVTRLATEQDKSNAKFNKPINPEDKRYKVTGPSMVPQL